MYSLPVNILSVNYSALTKKGWNLDCLQICKTVFLELFDNLCFLSLGKPTVQSLRVEILASRNEDIKPSQIYY